MDASPRSRKPRTLGGWLTKAWLIVLTILAILAALVWLAPAETRCRMMIAIRDGGSFLGDHEDWGGLCVSYSYREITPAMMDRLTQLSQVDEIQFDHCTIAVGALRGISALKNLRRIELKGISGDADGALREIGAVAQLDSLAILDSVFVTDAGVMELGELQQLRTLVLCNVNVTDKGLRGIAVLGNLRSLSIGTVRVPTAAADERSPVSDVGLSYLHGLHQLETLRLSGTSVTNAGLAYLAGYPKLTYLDLDGTFVSDEAIAYLEQCPSLHDVWVCDTSVSRRGAGTFTERMRDRGRTVQVHVEH